MIETTSPFRSLRATRTHAMSSPNFVIDVDAAKSASLVVSRLSPLAHAPRKTKIKVSDRAYVDETDFFARARTPESLKVRPRRASSDRALFSRVSKMFSKMFSKMSRVTDVRAQRKACAESLARDAGRAAKVRASNASGELADASSSPSVIEFSDEAYALSAPAAFRARRRARASLDECACALCEEPLRDLQHRSYEIINPWLRCHACERFVHARCAKAAGVDRRASCAESVG